MNNLIKGWEFSILLGGCNNILPRSIYYMRIYQSCDIKALNSFLKLSFNDSLSISATNTRTKQNIFSSADQYANQTWLLLIYAKVVWIGQSYFMVHTYSLTSKQQEKSHYILFIMSGELVNIFKYMTTVEYGDYRK